MLNIKPALLLILSMVVSTAALAERQWPETTYACQITTGSGAHGLVSLQSLSPQEAESGAIGKQAITLAGNKGAAVKVLQCIEVRPGAAFADSSFQGWYAKLDK
ncbi:Uncharacterised protein [Halioglobus japonicus]|nr:Uncharacterised protein [Halioglobus japonicus]